MPGGRPKDSEPRWFEKPEIDVLKIKELYESGLSSYSIVKQLNLPVDPNTVINFLRAAGVRIRGRYERILPRICPGCNCEFYIEDSGWNRKLCKICAPSVEWLNRFTQYGVTKPEFEAQLSKQNRLCDLCGKPLPDNFTAMRFDHCHKQGHMRGILHNKCNIGLHYIEDTEFIGLAVKYVEKWRR